MHQGAVNKESNFLVSPLSSSTEKKNLIQEKLRHCKFLILIILLGDVLSVDLVLFIISFSYKFFCLCSRPRNKAPNRVYAVKIRGLLDAWGILVADLRP